MSRRKLPANPNEWGPLTDLPDYSRLDGTKPNFTTKGQRIRKINNYLLMNKVMKQISEMKHTMSEYERIGQESTRKEKQFKERCFKSKGKHIKY